MNKLSELSKPVMYVVRTLDGSVASVKSHSYTAPNGFTSDPLYSQEYVSALLARIEELEKKETWRERQSVIDGLARSGEAWADIEEYMEKWDMEHRKAMGEQSVRYQCREIGEGGWMDCDKARYDYCQRCSEMDTRIVSSPPAELEVKDKRIAELERKLEESRETTLLVRDEWQKDKVRANEAEKRLATPVRLPDIRFIKVDGTAVAVMRADRVKEQIHHAGFKVEGVA